MGLCFSNILSDFKWNVLKEPHKSDHFPISLKLNAQCKTLAVARWNLSKANWALFLKEFSPVEDITSNIDCPVHAYNTLEQHTIKETTTAIPQINPSKGRPTVPWWDQTFKSLRKIALKSYDVQYTEPTHLKLIRLFIIGLLQKER